MSLIETALFLSQQWPCFPCDAAKRPITEHGFKDASRDPATIRAMFRKPGAALIGVPTGEASDLAVVDLDVKDGAPGLEWLSVNQHRLPATRQHATRSGGRHLLFRYPSGRRVRNSARKVAPGVDVRGEGGYIIAAPSDGYSIVDHSMPAPMPAWLLDLIDPPAPPPRAPEPYVPPSRADRATRYAEAALDAECAAVARAAEGSRNDQLNTSAFALGTLVGAGALSESTARDELRRAALHAGLDPRETALTIESGMSAGKQHPREIPERTTGVPIRERPTEAHVAPSATVSGSGQPLTDGGQPRGLPLVYWSDIAPSLGADDFVEGLLIKSGMSVIYGPSNCGKTFWASDLAMHVATGRKWNGREIEGGGVIYCALEGSYGIQNRVAAWRKHHGLEGVEVPFAIIPVAVNMLDPAADTERVIDAIRAAKEAMGCPVVWTIFDTLSRAMAGGNENSPEDMGALVTNGTRVQQVTQSHVSWIHHCGKDQAQGARGHSLLRAATDTEIEINRENKDSPSTARVTKQRELEIEGEWSFSLKTVELGRNRRGKVVTSCVVVEAEKSDAAGKVRLPPGAQFGLAALREAVIAGGKAPVSRDIPASVRVVTLEAWRTEFYRRSHLDSTDAKRQAFHRAIKELRDKDVVGVLNDFVWIAKGE